MTNFDKLPIAAATRHPVTGETILLKPGVKGYFTAPPNLDPDAYNRDMRVTPHQLRAMEIGAIFGFHVPGADPVYHDMVKGGAKPVTK